MYRQPHSFYKAVFKTKTFLLADQLISMPVSWNQTPEDVSTLPNSLTATHTLFPNCKECIWLPCPKKAQCEKDGSLPTTQESRFCYAFVFCFLFNKSEYPVMPWILKLYEILFSSNWDSECFIKSLPHLIYFLVHIWVMYRGWVLVLQVATVMLFFICKLPILQMKGTEFSCVFPSPPAVHLLQQACKTHMEISTSHRCSAHFDTKCTWVSISIKKYPIEYAKNLFPLIYPCVLGVSLWVLNI